MPRVLCSVSYHRCGSSGWRQKHFIFILIWMIFLSFIVLYSCIETAVLSSFYQLKKKHIFNMCAPTTGLYNGWLISFWPKVEREALNRSCYMHLHFRSSSDCIAGLKFLTFVVFLFGELKNCKSQYQALSVTCYLCLKGSPKEVHKDM